MMVNARILLGLGIAAALVAGAARADDLASRALRERQQQSDAFSLQLQQSIQSYRAGPMTPQQRLDFEGLQRDQRVRQDELNYRQQIRQAEPGSPNTDALRRAELLRFEQDRQNQLSRFRWEGEPPAPAAAPPRLLVEPGVVTAPVPRRIPQGHPGGWVEWVP